MDKKKIKELPKFQRPREKLMEKGAEALKDYELLAILLGSGYKGQNVLEVSKRLLNEYPATKFVELPFNKLKELKGIGPAKACAIKAALELNKRVLGKTGDFLPEILTPKDVVQNLAEFRNNKKENFFILCLNARNQLIYKEKIFVGSLNASIVHPREVFQPAILNFAASIILAHNHPSGDSEPSEDDINITKKLTNVGRFLGIEIVDHIIIGSDSFVSLKDRDLIKQE